MRRLLFLILLLACAASANAQTMGVVCKDIATAENIGKDSVFAKVATHFGYNLTYLDEDVVRSKAFYDTFKVVVTVGEEVSGLTTNNLDTVGISTTGWVALGYRQWNEINLGTNAESDICTYGYVLNIANSHWITRVLQDTIIYLNQDYGSDNVFRSLTFPDSSHNIKPLIINYTRSGDTAKVILAVADEGDTIINTGDGNWEAQGRRVFCGMLSPQYGVGADSCQQWTTIYRAIAWAAKDTLNDAVMKRICFSQWHEFEDDAPMEPGGNALMNYGSWPQEYYGYDWGKQINTFTQISPEALLRKIIHEYRSITVDSVNLVLRYLSDAWDITEPPTWEVAWTLRNMLVAWSCGHCTKVQSGPSCPHASYTYRWVDTSTTPDTYYAWNTPGARGIGTDVSATHATDSIVVTQATPNDSWLRLRIDTTGFSTNVMDTATFHGWAGSYLYTSYGEGAGVELYYHSTEGSFAKRPFINVFLNSYSTDSPDPHIVLSGSTLSPSGVMGGTVVDQYVSVTNSTGGSMTYAAANDSAWMSLAYSPNAPSTITASFSYGQRPAGTYEDTITVTCGDADNSPQKCVVTLTITGPPPPAQVTKMSGFLRAKQ